ncbi:MAG: Threonine dehydrogenase and related Zn-dependent dehydrogenases, partial [uncultured Sphingomonadaceae bacterium]
ACSHLAGPTQDSGRYGSRSRDRQPARRDHQDHLHRDLRVGPPPLRRLHPDDAAGRHPGPREYGRGGRGRPQEHAEEGAAGRDPVHHLVRQLLLLRQAAILGVRQRQPCDHVRPVRDAVRIPDGRRVRLRASDGRLCGRTGRISARSLFGRRPDRHPRRHGRRRGAVPVRHPAHRLDGGGECRDRGRRHG